ncbi:MAG: hypothetical protein GY799_25510 [Desulfobulbaceae bacterium]|nr:hypothetical protein [Desulfobulbaceae bacterium]
MLLALTALQWDNRIKSIPIHIRSPHEISHGVYWKLGKCGIPLRFTIILANGGVHPCNIVEYTHERIMGNIFETIPKDIWVSEQWNNFRQNLHKNCHLCPMNIHTSIPYRVEKSRFSRLTDSAKRRFGL